MNPVPNVSVLAAEALVEKTFRKLQQHFPQEYSEFLNQTKRDEEKAKALLVEMAMKIVLDVQVAQKHLSDIRLGAQMLETP